MRFDPRRVWDLGFPAPPMGWRNHLAVAITDEIDRDALHQLLQRKRKNHTMSESTVLAIPQSPRSGSKVDYVPLRPVHEVAPLAAAPPPASRWGSPEHATQRDADAAVAAELRAADEAATTSGTSFRDAMRKITELQSTEIARLRGIIADYSTERPRRVVTVAPKNNERGEPRGVLAVCDDGTIWGCSELDPIHAKWVRCKDIPQPSDTMGAE